tara:strand:- start:270 stop:482 length:213 start_codon:yes stop_codon:yes gene_type:complete
MRPRLIDIKAATIEIRIVFPIPETKNFILIHPDGVVGFITYQPHMSEEHPANARQVKHKIRIFFILNLMF